MATASEISIGASLHALLPPDLVQVLRLAGRLGDELAQPAYLVGGSVRDLLLGRVHDDVDLAVEGDAAVLARALAATLGTRVVTHPEFGTATVWLTSPAHAESPERGEHERYIDLASTRTETYRHPGALPTVTLGADLAADLRRRDFALNALAGALSEQQFGRVIDPFGGADDLAAGRLAVLHAASFQDDPTRLVRGVRLAGRLWLRLAPPTEALALAAVESGALLTVSRERRVHELDLLLEEPRPALALAFARALGLLDQLEPCLWWDEWSAERLHRSVPWVEQQPRTLVRLLLLCYRGGVTELERVEQRLHLTRPARAAIDALLRWRERRQDLAAAASGVDVASLLKDLPLPVLAAARLAEDEPAIQRNLDWYVLDLSRRMPRLGGDALRALGVPPGPIYRDILGALHRAMLNGEVPDEEAEWRFLRARVAALDGQYYDGA